MPLDLTTEIGLGAVRTTPLKFAVRASTELERDGMNIRIDTRFDMDAETETVTTQLQVTYLPIGVEEEVDPILQLELKSTVTTKDVLKHLEGEELPMALKATMLGIALGTARGMIKAQAAGYAVVDFELPVINPTVLLEGTIANVERLL